MTKINKDNECVVWGWGEIELCIIQCDDARKLAQTQPRSEENAKIYCDSSQLAPHLSWESTIKMPFDKNSHARPIKCFFFRCWKFMSCSIIFLVWHRCLHLSPAHLNVLSWIFHLIGDRGGAVSFSKCMVMSHVSLFLAELTKNSYKLIHMKMLLVGIPLSCDIDESREAVWKFVTAFFTTG